MIDIEGGDGNSGIVDFFISTERGMTLSVGRSLFERKDVISACTCIGNPEIDLRIEAIARSNREILDMLENIKGMEGVRDASWSEVIQVIGRKTLTQSRNYKKELVVQT